MPAFHGGEPATNERRNGCLRKSRERFSGYFLRLGIYSGVLAKLGENTEANLASGSCINVREKEKACGQGQR